MEEAHYKVAIMPLIGVPGAGGTPIAGKYWSPATTPLEYTVLARNEPTFEMDRADPRQPQIKDDP